MIVIVFVIILLSGNNNHNYNNYNNLFYLKVTFKTHRVPVNLLEDRSDVVKGWGSGDDMGS